MANSETELETKEEDPFAWDVHMEVQLFYAMAGLKPVGINKHFHMACIWEKLSNSITKEITTDHIWKQLDTLYDISILDETEALPFPNSEMDFSLPDSQYNELIKQKCRDAILSEEVEEIITPPGTVEDASNLSSASNTPKSVVKAPVSSKDNTPKASNKREPSEKSNPSSGGSNKTRKESAGSLPDTPTTSVASSEKETTAVKTDRSERERRRDSRDSNTSGSHAASTKAKDRVKSRSSNAPSEELDGSFDGSRRGGKRHTRGATRPDESTPSSQRRRRN